jgi:phosphomannomutase
MQPKLTVSGYRGIWGTTLTKEIAQDFTRAFSEFTQKRNAKTMFVARDGRESGTELCEAIIETLTREGLKVINLGMLPTPIVLFLIQNKKAEGGIIVTASHNPIEYNGLKFVTHTGFFTTEAEVAEIELLRESMRESAPTAEPRRGTRIEEPNLFETYLSTLIQNINVASIQKNNFKIALDPINSVGCTTTPKLLEKLGVTFSIINGEPTGNFAHEPEPLPKNLTGLQLLVHETHSDVGFAQDPDGDRLVICDETGDIPTEETMLALCVKAVLIKNPGTIVLNLSTSRMSEDIATSFGCKTIRSKVGEANVVSTMITNNAVVGGEGGGGIIWPIVNTARDSFVGIALILELMAIEQKPLSQIIAELPHYTMIKEKISFSRNLADLYKKIKTVFPEGIINSLDGLRLDFEDSSWVHIRPSNTEPVLRIIAEAKTPERALQIIALTKTVIEPISK